MPHPTAVILVVGLTRRMLAAMPRLSAFADAGCVREVTPVFPALTCSVQSSMLTGRPVGGALGHGVVGNGWCDRALSEVHFWKQSNHLVEGEKVWEAARRRDPSVTTANIGWWFNMASSVEYALTPRPVYTADGRKVPDCWTSPADLREHIQSRLGPFPLFQFWGPGASIVSSRWLADAAKLVYDRHRPTLTLLYLPHLDYAHQKHGPNSDEGVAAAAEVDAVCGELIDYFTAASVRPIFVSEYGIEPVNRAVPINRVLREAGFLSLRVERGREVLDTARGGAGEGHTAFAVADHQVAQVYIKNAADIPAIAELFTRTPGIDACFDVERQRPRNLDHARAGDLIAVASEGSWFTYGWWLEDDKAPDYARTVDIHRKPGYDPLELFLDPALRFPRATVASKLLLRKLGFRSLLNVIPLDPSLVKGSHGRVGVSPEYRPLLITDASSDIAPDPFPCTSMPAFILDHLFKDR